MKVFSLNKSSSLAQIEKLLQNGKKKIPVLAKKMGCGVDGVLLAVFSDPARFRVVDGFVSLREKDFVMTAFQREFLNSLCERPAKRLDKKYLRLGDAVRWSNNVLNTALKHVVTVDLGHPSAMVLLAGLNSSFLDALVSRNVLLSDNERFIAWDTGMCNETYERLFAICEKENVSETHWTLKGLTRDGQCEGRSERLGEELARNFPSLPEYVESSSAKFRSTFFVPDEMERVEPFPQIALNYAHLIAHPERYPLSWWKRLLGLELDPLGVSGAEEQLCGKAFDTVKSALFSTSAQRGVFKALSALVMKALKLAARGETVIRSVIYRGKPTALLPLWGEGSQPLVIELSKCRPVGKTIYEPHFASRSWGRAYAF